MNPITLSPNTSLNLPPALRKGEVFISYSRKDQEFVRSLDAAFTQLGREPWVDWGDIEKGEEWWKAIQRGIEAAHTFIFVLSPDSVESKVCAQEIEYATQLHKRFLPIVRREGFAMDSLHPSISGHNWLFFRETDDQEQAFKELLAAVDTDLSYVRRHSRLLVRALEWQHKGNDASYLLRGSDLRDAQQWLTQSFDKNPKPTELQGSFINASQEFEAKSLKRRQRAKWVVLLTTVLGNMAIAAAACLWFYNFATDQADQQVKRDLQKALNVGLVGIDGDRFEQLVQRRITNNFLSLNDPLYREHQTWLFKVHSAIPMVYPRTFFLEQRTGQMRIIGDVGRELQGNLPVGDRISQFWQPFSPRPEAQKVYTNSEEQYVTITPFKDELGEWISAYGAIRNSAGKTVGGLRVDCDANVFRAIQRDVRNKLAIAYFGIFLWFVLLSIIILSVTRPTQESVPQSPKQKVGESRR